MSKIIECPYCHEQIDVESALSHKLEADYSRKLLKEKERMEAIYEAQKREDKEAFKLKMREQLLTEVNEEMEDLRNSLTEQQSKLKEFRQKEIELLGQKRKLQEEKDAFELKMQRQLDVERNKMRQDILQQEEQKYKMKLGDKEQHIAGLNKTIEELQRKAEQGSMQAQGETFEIELEKLLTRLFPMDRVEEVKKGSTGSDVIHCIKNSFGKECGKISYESKRTKAFSEKWMEKLKGDMRNQGADLGVIVTETLPSGMKTFGIHDGIWICKFNEVEALSFVLRDSLLRISEVKSSEEHRGDKMEMLYDFLTSTEFKFQIQAIVDSFSSLKEDLEREKRAMNKLWKQREKQLDKVLMTTSEMYGSIRGIAGNAVQEVALLDFNLED